MAVYSIIDENSYSNRSIASEMFGANFVASYDFEFTANSEITDLLAELNVDNFRYPGGSITEIMFAEIEYQGGNWADSYFSAMGQEGTNLHHLEDFMGTAARAGGEVQLVLPTRIAFAQTAVEALQYGNYGQRTEINREYYELLETFVSTAIDLAQRAGTSISRLEIGNEFWGSGQMTASEYGYLSGQVSTFLSDRFSNIDIIMQVTGSANQYSPYADRNILLMPDEDGYAIDWWQEDGEVIPEDRISVVMPGQGSGTTQTTHIAEQIMQIPGAIDSISGIVDHVYFEAGFAGIDTERNHALYVIPEIFRNITGVDDVDYFITEWGPRSRHNERFSTDTNHIGLQYASTLVEGFFELAASGVRGTNFWPLTFGNPNIDLKTLIDTSEGDLTFGGVAFQMLSESTVGLAPLFDFEVPDEIDIHGFGAPGELILFVSERSGSRGQNTDTISTSVDLGQFRVPGENLVSVAYLTEDGTTGMDVNANPIMQFSGASIQSSPTLDLSLSPWGLARVTIQQITDGNDILDGTHTDDVIKGADGDDVLNGHEGNDQLNGNFGADALYGGAGDDTLKGGWGNDTLAGGSGDDNLYGIHSSNHLYGGEGSDYLHGGTGPDVLFGGAGNDTILALGEANYLDGGNGDDLLRIEATAIYDDGRAAFNSNTESQAGTGVYVPIDGFLQIEGVVLGGPGQDVLELSQGGDAFFLDDSYSSIHGNVPVTTDDTGTLNAARLSGVEAIFAGQGDDLIDLISPTYSLMGIDMTIDGGDGNDIIWGSDANERIQGGSGNDTIFGGTGVDVLVGGAGADAFEFTATSATVTIEDFDASEGDRIRIYTSGQYHVDASDLSFDGEVFSINFSSISSGTQETVTVNVNVNFSYSHGVLDDAGIISVTDLL